MLLDPDLFTAAAAQLPPTAAHVDGRAEPITGVEVMGGLINRRREFLCDGEPVINGVHAVGDAHTATNPLYGRGCSLAMVQAALLCDALAGHGDDARGRSIHYERRCESEILPWHTAAVSQDRMGRLASQSGSPIEAMAWEATEADFMRSMLREGLLPAMRVDPVVLRAFLRMFNLLEPPNSLMADPDVIGRVMNVYQDRDARAPEPPLGPDRTALIAALA